MGFSKENAKEKELRLLNETGRIAKIGGWELNIETQELTWTEETFRILEVEKSENRKPILPEGLALFTENSAPIINRAVERAIQFGEPYDLEVEALTAKGRVVWVRTNGVANYVDGKIYSLSGTIQDITDRKQNEIEKRFLSESLGFGIWEYDPISQNLEWDNKMYEIFDIDPKDFSGAYSAWESSLTPASKAIAIKELELALSGEKQFNTEFEILTRKGETRVIAGRGIVFRDDKNRAIKMHGINWDVTDRIEKEKQIRNINMQLIQSAKLASLGEMSAAIAHEINNPLTIIKSSIELIGGKYKNDQVKIEAKIKSILKSCDRITKIINGLRKFSRSGEIAEFSVHKVEDLVSESISLMELKAKNNFTELLFETKSQAQIFCNEIEIQQVFVNIIGNAIDATKDSEHKWVKVNISENATEVWVDIIDSGAGIPDHIRTKIFDPFFTTKVIGEGTGLGLSISKGILDSHDAKIILMEQGENTCFQVRFKKKN